MTETANSLIHIGKPISFDERNFFERLERLYEAAYDETDEMKQLVSDLVPTYQVKPEDKKRDEELLEGQFRELGDQEKKHKVLKY